MIVTVLIIEFLAFCNLTVSVTAFIGHRQVLGVTTGVVAVVLIGAAWLVIRTGRTSRNVPGG